MTERLWPQISPNATSTYIFNAKHDVMTFNQQSIRPAAVAFGESGSLYVTDLKEPHSIEL